MQNYFLANEATAYDEETMIWSPDFYRREADEDNNTATVTRYQFVMQIPLAFHGYFTQQLSNECTFSFHEAKSTAELAENLMYTLGMLDMHFSQQAFRDRAKMALELIVSVTAAPLDVEEIDHYETKLLRVNFNQSLITSEQLELFANSLISALYETFYVEEVEDEDENEEGIDTGEPLTIEEIERNSLEMDEAVLEDVDESAYWDYGEEDVTDEEEYR